MFFKKRGKPFISDQFDDKSQKSDSSYILNHNPFAYQRDVNTERDLQLTLWNKTDINQINRIE
ncbi:MAG: hypothetical protein RIG62_15125 [Cyclobacteriaceae bacterium]